MEIKDKTELKNIVKDAVSEALSEILQRGLSADNRKCTEKPAENKKKEKNPEILPVPENTEQPVCKPKEYSFTEVRSILTEKSRAGFTAKVKELVNKYGNGKLSEVKPENFGILVEEAELNCREPFTSDDIREEVKKLEDDGFGSSIKELFEHHFATSADDLKPEYYPSFVRDCRRMRNAGN